jgi:hypothetical protein
MFSFPGAPKRFISKEEKLASKCRELKRLNEIKDKQIAELINELEKVNEKNLNLEKVNEKNLNLEKAIQEKDELLASYENPSNT